MPCTRRMHALTGHSPGSSAPRSSRRESSKIERRARVAPKARTRLLSRQLASITTTLVQADAVRHERSSNQPAVTEPVQLPTSQLSIVSDTKTILDSVHSDQGEDLEQLHVRLTNMAIDERAAGLRAATTTRKSPPQQHCSCCLTCVQLRGRQE